jgi:hypothetical protein
VSHVESVLPSGVTLQRVADPEPLPAAFGQPLPDHVLERIALHWAEAEGVPPPHVIMREEDLGYAIWAPGHRVAYSTFADKVTGRRVGFPNPNRPDKQYANQLEREDGLLPRPGFGGPEVDPPAVVAEIALAEGNDRFYPACRAVSARTGEPPALHPLVAERLHGIPPGARDRGVERHAELIALGAALTAADAVRADDGRPPVTADELERAAVRARVEVHRVRDPGDPRTGGRGDPCQTCARVLGVPGLPLRWASWGARLSARARMHLSPSGPPGDVVSRVSAIAGVHGRHEPSPAAVTALTRYLGKTWDFDGPGRDVRSSRFSIDPMAVADSADTLARVAGRLGTSLFPLGSAGLEGILAIAPDRRVLLVDESGEWLLGPSPRRALDTLMLGRAAPRIP